MSNQIYRMTTDELDMNSRIKVPLIEPLNLAVADTAAKAKNTFGKALDPEFPLTVYFPEKAIYKRYKSGVVDFVPNPRRQKITWGETNVLDDLNRQKKELERQRDSLRNLVAQQEQNCERLELEVVKRHKSEQKLRQLNNDLEQLAEKRSCQLNKVIAERKQTEEELQQSLDNLHKTLTATVQAMTLTVEARDPYTAGHQRRVADLAQAIADEMGLPADQVNGIRMACLVHDLGKLSIPLEILSKPRRLTPIEFGLIQTHLEAGFAILQGIEFPWPIAEIVLQHHERLDGSGYPGGLSSRDILLEAKVLAVADVVEAMATHRPYRQALGIDAALEEITGKRGSAFDPEVVDACLRLFAEKRYQFN